MGLLTQREEQIAIYLKVSSPSFTARLVQASPYQSFAKPITN
jgi:hypothetical protein